MRLSPRAEITHRLLWYGGEREGGRREAGPEGEEGVPPGQSARGDIAHNMQWRGRAGGGVAAAALMRSPLCMPA